MISGHERIEAARQQNAANGHELGKVVNLQQGSVVADSHVTADLGQGQEGDIGQRLVIVESQ